MNTSTKMDATAAAATGTATVGEDEDVLCLSTHLIDRSVTTEIERVQAAKSSSSSSSDAVGGKIVWPAQLVVRMSASSLQLEDATDAVPVCALEASDSDFSWVCAYLRLLHRCTAPRTIEARPPASASSTLAVV